MAGVLNGRVGVKVNLFSLLGSLVLENSSGIEGGEALGLNITVADVVGTRVWGDGILAIELGHSGARFEH